LEADGSRQGEVSSALGSQQYPHVALSVYNCLFVVRVRTSKTSETNESVRTKHDGDAMAFDQALVPQSLEDVKARYGSWTAMSIHLGGGRYTLTPPQADRRLKRFVQMVADLAGKPLDKLRVLDLACLEGHYAIEFALHGAQSVGIEGREANIEKARCVQKELSLTNVEFYQDDVRNLTREKYGGFDVVICAGILYHLDTPDVFDVVKSIYSVCDRLAIFETFVSLRDTHPFEYDGKKYWGLHYKEHDESDSTEKKSKKYWSSIDNTRSVWLTHASLCNLLNHVGFTSVYQCHNPSLVGLLQDRLTYVAIKGTKAQVRSSPITEELSDEDWPRQEHRQFSEAQRQRGPVWRFLKRFLPAGAKDLIKPLLRALGVMAPTTRERPKDGAI